MSVKKIAAVFAAAAIIGSATYSLTDNFILDDVVMVSAASSLRRNSTGSEVTKLQKNLIKLNYLKSGSATGKYGSATEAAVKQFQTDYQLYADGIAGAKTLNLIASIINGTVKTVEVKATLLNVRHTASPNGKLLTTAKKGQKYVVEGEDSESDGTKWYKISTKFGSGYVCADYVSVLSEANNTTSNTTSKQGIIRVTGNVLNVRQSASTSSKKLYTVKSGQTYYYSETKSVNGETWYHIKVNSSVSGWVLGQWVTVVQSTNETASSAKSGKLKVAVPILQVRKSTSTTSKRLYTTKRDEEYSFSNVKSVDGVNWYYIKVNKSISGWVLGTMVNVIPKDSDSTVTTEKTTKNTTSADPNGGTVTVNVDQLNVREAASTSSKKVFIAKRNQVYTYSKTQKVDDVEWYHIKVNNSISGWVMGTYVKVKPNSTATTEATSKATQTQTTQSSDPHGGSLTVTADALNVRESATTSSKKLFVVKQNQTYSYSETKKVGNDTWYHIKVNNSIDGWVMGSYVKAVPNGSTDTTKSTTAANTGSKTLTVVADALNVRESPSTSSKKVFLVKNGQKYTFSNTKTVDNATWYYIKVNNSISGWVMGTYVKTEAPASTTAATKSTTAAAKSTTATTKATTAATSSKKTSGGKLSITANLLNVRSEATTNSKIVTTVKNGKTFAYTDVKTVNGEKWYFIIVNTSKKGWVNGGYITIIPDEDTVTTAAKKTTTEATKASTTEKPETKATTKATTTAPAEVSGNVVVEANLLNVRLEPSSTATVIGTVKKDNIFEFTKTKTAEGITWYYINVSNVRCGWVMGTYVKVLDENATVKTTPKNGTLTVISDNVDARMGAGSNYESVFVVNKNETYKYIDIKDGWYRISLPDNKTGWIASAYVKVNGSPNSGSNEETTASTTDSTTAGTVGSTTTEETTASSAAASSSSASATKTETTKSSAKASTPSKPESTTSTTGIPVSPTAAAGVTKNVTVGTVKVSSSALLVRKGPGTEYAKIGSVSNGSTVVIVSKGSSWHEIEYGTGTGYVSASCIKNITSKTEEVALSYASDYYYINVGQSINLGRTVSGSTVKYTTSSASKCPVTETGVVSGVKEGLYYITASCEGKSTGVYVAVLKEPNKDLQTFKVSEKGVRFIADWEGGDTILPNGDKVFYPYKDVSGFWTLGYGHAKTSTASKSWSEERAIEEFNEDIKSLIGEEYVLTKKRPYLTADAAEKLLRSDLNQGDYVKSINNWAVRNGVQLNQVQFDALVSFCYNIGTSLWNSDSTKFYLKSAIISHRSGSEADPNQIIKGFCLYHKSSGKAYKGLWYRRRNEAELFLTGDYAIDRANKFTLPSDISWS